MKFVETCLTIQCGYFKKGTKGASLLPSPVHLGGNTSVHVGRQRSWVQWVIYAPLSQEDLSPHAQELEVLGHDIQVSQGETFSHIPWTHSWCDRTPQSPTCDSLHKNRNSELVSQDLLLSQGGPPPSTVTGPRDDVRGPHTLSVVSTFHSQWTQGRHEGTPYSVRSDLSPQAQGSDQKRQDFTPSQVRALPTLREPTADGTGHCLRLESHTIRCTLQANALLCRHLVYILGIATISQTWALNHFARTQLIPINIILTRIIKMIIFSILCSYFSKYMQHNTHFKMFEQSVMGE